MSSTNQITPAANASASTDQIDLMLRTGGGFILGFGVVGGGAIAGSSGGSSASTNVRQIDSSLPHPTPTTTNQISP